MKLRVRIIFIVIIVCLKSFGQSVSMNIKAGSLIIPMDNSKQNLTSAQLGFNVKAYGLVNALLQNHIPVKWIIKNSKLKDEVDFSVLASRVFPSVTGASATSFKAGPFIIDSLWAGTAMPIIASYGNSVAVYRAQAAFTAPVRYELMFKPKIAVFTNGNSQLVHTKALRLAGFSSPAHFDSIPAQNAGATSCYTFGCEPHWDNGQNAVTNVITSFLNSGGNFFAQCAGISAYEQIEHHHTTNGIEYESTPNLQDNANLYSGNDNPLMQFEGNLTNAPTGTIVNFQNNSGSYRPLTQFLVKKDPLPASGVNNGDVVMSNRKTGPAPVGGNVTYLGGHDYLKAASDLGEYARANDMTWNNGLRIFYNAIFMPSTRPTSCEFVFAGEAKVSVAINNTVPCLDDTVQFTISFTNAGPGTAHNIQVKTGPLPAGLTYVSNTSSQGTYSAGTNTWVIGQLAPNTPVQLTVHYKITADGTYNLKAFNSNPIAGNAFSEDTSSVVFTTNQSSPVLLAPAAINAFTNSGCTATGVSLGSPTVTDDCGITSLTNNAPSSFPLGATTVTWTVTDNSGNTATASQTVTVTDNQNPTITAPSNVNTFTNSGCTAVGTNLGAPVTSDNCGVASVTNNAPSAFPVGTTTVIWTVTDNSGNTATASQTVTVTDNQNPTITAPSNVNTLTNSGCTAVGINLGTPVTSDNCGVASVTNNAPSTFPLGVTTVTWTVTDNFGNTATANQTVTVTDNQNPTITAPSNVNTFTNSGCTAVGTNLGTPVTSDNCGVPSVTNNAPSAFPVGTTTVIWTVTDNFGNTATANQTVTVTDNQNPTITAPSNVNTFTNSGCTAVGTNLGAPVTSDNCGVASVTNNAPSAFPVGTTTVIWTVTDNSGNTASAIQTVSISDSEAPLFSNCNDTIKSCESVVHFELPSAVDNCMLAEFNQTDGTALTSGSLFPEGYTDLQYEAIDVAGNQAVCTKVIYKIQLPALPNAGEDQQTYAAETQLNAVPDVFGIGEWNIVEGSAYISDHNNPKSTISGLQKGNTVLTWTMANEGCVSGIDSVAITCLELDIPNAFSPDGDNHNDFFEIKGIENYSPANMIITNRWGEIVYESTNYMNDWNGQSKGAQDLTNDTYYYQLVLVDKSEFSGFVILKRR